MGSVSILAPKFSRPLFGPPIFSGTRFIPEVNSEPPAALGFDFFWVLIGISFFPGDLRLPLTELTPVNTTSFFFFFLKQTQEIPFFSRVASVLPIPVRFFEERGGFFLITRFFSFFWIPFYAGYFQLCSGLGFHLVVFFSPPCLFPQAAPRAYRSLDPTFLFPMSSGFLAVPFVFALARPHEVPGRLFA